MVLPIRVHAQYGETSSSEFSRELLEPSTDALSALFREMSKWNALINIHRLDDSRSEELLQVMSQIDTRNDKRHWKLLRPEVGTTYEVACNDPAIAVSIIAEWATTKTAHGQSFGGYDWSPLVLPDLGEYEEDAIFFDPNPEPLVPVDHQPFTMLKLIDKSTMLPIVKQSLSDAWQRLSANEALDDIYAYGLDRLSEGFLVTVGYRHGASDGIEELLVDIEEANDMVRQAWELLEEIEQTHEIDSSPGYEQIVETTYEVGITALNELRAEGVFSEAPNVILNVWHREQEPLDIETVRRCNPPEIAALAQAAPPGMFSS